MVQQSEPAYVADAVADRIRVLVERRGLQPGARLPAERELSNLLGVSRPTVREALSRLSEEGTMVTRRGSGTYLAPLNLRHVFEVRLQLEPFAASLAAQTRTPQDLGRLSELIADLEKTLDDVDRFVASDLAFHAAVAQATGNTVLIDVLERLTGLGRITRDITAADRRVRAETLRQLRRISGAIRKRDAVTASTAMRSHLEHVLAVSGSGLGDRPELTVINGIQPPHSPRSGRGTTRHPSTDTRSAPGTHDRTNETIRGR